VKVGVCGRVVEVLISGAWGRTNMDIGGWAALNDVCCILNMDGWISTVELALPLALALMVDPHYGCGSIGCLHSSVISSFVQ
jgi:hypothetical protein